VSYMYAQFNNQCKWPYLQFTLKNRCRVSYWIGNLQNTVAEHSVSTGYHTSPDEWAHKQATVDDHRGQNEYGVIARLPETKKQTKTQHGTVMLH
jgi:hypothetical protein